MQKIKALLIASIIFTGCKINQQACEAYSQCDELYNDYNCDIQPRILTTPQYPYGSMPVYGTRAYPAYNYGYPYSNYNYIYINDCGDVPSSSSVTNRPRPSIYHNGPSNSGRPAIENGSNGAHRKPQKDAPTSRKTRD